MIPMTQAQVFHSSDIQKLMLDLLCWHESQTPSPLFSFREGKGIERRRFEHFERGKLTFLDKFEQTTTFFAEVINLMLNIHMVLSANAIDDGHTKARFLTPPFVTPAVDHAIKMLLTHLLGLNNSKLLICLFGN